MIFLDKECLRDCAYKFRDKKMLKEWSKGELINLIIQLIDLLYDSGDDNNEQISKINKVNNR